MKKGISADLNLTKVATQLTQNGIEFVFRYYCATTEHPQKRLTPDEAQALTNAGLAIAVVYEENPTRAEYFSTQRGQDDCTAAWQYAQQLKQPTGTAIYFAVDYDASQHDIEHAISDYFVGVDQAMREAGYTIGVYGSGATCAWLKDTYDFVKYTWLAESTGWLGSAHYDTWTVNQKPAHGPLAGLPADGYEICQAQPEFGQFTLPIPTPAVPA